ncbi:MAG: hypothetical protein M1815_004404 [Lichina confinis]|nr:MAG: hypothetical protein M1815_004404 [Lichina confinis]
MSSLDSIKAFLLAAYVVANNCRANGRLPLVGYDRAFPVEEIFLAVVGWRALPKPRRLLLLPAPPRRLLITFPPPPMEVLVPAMVPEGPPTLSVVTFFSPRAIEATESTLSDSAHTGSPPDSAGTVSPPTSLSPPSSPLIGPDVKPLDHQIEAAPGPLTSVEDVQGEHADDEDDQQDDDEVTITAANFAAAAPAPSGPASPSIEEVDKADETPTTATKTTTTITTTTPSSTPPVVSATAPPPPPPPAPAAGPSIKEIDQLIDSSFPARRSLSWADEDDEDDETTTTKTTAPPAADPVTLPLAKSASPSMEQINKLFVASFGAGSSSWADDDNDDETTTKTTAAPAAAPTTLPLAKPVSPSMERVNKLFEATFGGRRSSSWADEDDEDDETTTKPTAAPAATLTAPPTADPVKLPLAKSASPSMEQVNKLFDATFGGRRSSSWVDDDDEDDDDKGLCGAPVQQPVPSAPSEFAPLTAEEEWAARQATGFSQWQAFANNEGNASFAPGFDPRQLIDTEERRPPSPRTLRAIHHWNRYAVPVEYATSTPYEVSVWAHGAYQRKAARANAGERQPLWRSLRVQLLEHLACRTVDVPGCWFPPGPDDNDQHSVVEGEGPGNEEEKEVGSGEQEA